MYFNRNKPHCSQFGENLSATLVCYKLLPKKLSEFELLDMFAEVHLISPYVMENINVKNVTTECFDLTFCGLQEKTYLGFN